MKGYVYSYWLYGSELRWYVTITLQLEMMCYYRLEIGDDV